MSIERLTHTPGPWYFMTDSTGEYLAVYAKPQGGTKVICPVKIADEADAHLVATAPRLLAALKNMIEPFAGYLSDIGGCDHEVGICMCHDKAVLADARDAIAKAEGR